ncbi:hypothetical protein EMPG_16994 [Blastomyces silverae]|uniref:Uncharacterized protein n=1 Tax=Blastomyces silverae TaxID=2060906 RepID=A0A0H1BEA0_9EURO|nr:hypothetical protein EMPG_16994 [Blastomyces silverae]
MSVLGFRYRDAFSISISRKEAYPNPKAAWTLLRRMTRVGIPALSAYFSKLIGAEGSNSPSWNPKFRGFQAVETFRCGSSTLFQHHEISMPDPCH